jgi:hypothetical protein
MRLTVARSNRRTAVNIRRAGLTLVSVMQLWGELVTLIHAPH